MNSRRAFLQCSALGLAGSTISRAGMPSPHRSFGRAKSVIVLWMSGGPPQHETWDPKPDAVAEVRGPFGSIPTSVPGYRIGEWMPHTAALCHTLCVIRSMATNNPSHPGATYELLTGMDHPAGKGNDNIQSSRRDFPYFGAVVKHLRRPVPGVPTTVVLPQKIFNVPEWPGQYAGFLGSGRDAWHVLGDPSSPEFKIDDLNLPPDIADVRIADRRTLNGRLDRLSAGADGLQFRNQAEQAYDLLTTPRMQAAFDLRKESPSLRDRYGRHHFGQSCLLARRLVEAGVALVQVNWYREKDDDTPMWDFHWRLEENVRKKMPPMDRGYSALIEDLDQRSLLDDTLVVWVGEMGRTPKLEYIPPHPAPGRNHWGGVFSLALAGAGLRGGRIVGSSDKNAAYPKDNPIGPQDLTATLFHALGIPPDTEIRDLLNRPLPVSRGTPMTELW